MTKRLKDANDAILVAGRWCIEFDGTPKTVDTGRFYPAQSYVLGSCFYECWTCILPGGGSGRYDWSDGFGGAHGMLRNPVNGNFTIGSAVTAATNASPIAITTQDNIPFITGDTVIIAGVLGNTAANGTWTITKTGAKNFTLNSSTGNGAYTSGGVAEGPGGFGASGSLSFGADDVAYDNQWHHSATGIDIDQGVVVMYYDGVPVGYTSFTGNRVVPSSSNLHGYMGGSDHSNYLGRISQYRIFEGNLNPHKSIVGINSVIPYQAFAPEMVFGSDWDEAGGNGARASFVCSFLQPGQIADRGQGFPVGTVHSAVPKGVAGQVTDVLHSSPPQFVIDASAPDPQNPAQPAGKTYTPASVPSGALVFDSIQRKNSTYAFNGVGGIGSTEGGSRGPLAWTQTPPTAPFTGYAFGILNEQFVFLGQTPNGFGGLAWLEVGQANQDIRVSRKASQSWGVGISTSILFRYKDANNYWYAITFGSTAAGQLLCVGKVVAGVTTQLHHNVACPSSWTTLKVTTKSTGVYAVFCDATSVVGGTDAALETETKAGVIAMGDPQAYGVGTATLCGRGRWRNFTVFDNP
jgi:hypothetical protein